VQTIRLLRIEDHVSGPFRDGPRQAMNKALAGNRWSEYHAGDDFPTPAQEGLRGWQRGKHLTAVRNERLLRRWFPKAARKALTEYSPDFVVATYEVPAEDVIEGRMQSVFNPARAKRVASIPAASF
jgi:hypothetical protein